MKTIITHNDWYQCRYIDYYNTEIKFNYYMFDNTLNFRDSCIQAAKRIKKRFPHKIINIFYSGGMDSEALIEIFTLASIDFQIYTFKVYDEKKLLVNPYDINSVEQYITANKLRSKHQYIDYTLNLKEIVKYSKTNINFPLGSLCQDLAITKHFLDNKFINIVGRISNTVNLRNANSYTLDLTLFSENENIIHFYWYSMEILNSYIQERHINPITQEQEEFIQNTRDPSKVWSSDIYKIYMYIRYFNLKVRKDFGLFNKWKNQDRITAKKLTYWHNLPKKIKQSLREQDDCNLMERLSNRYQRFHNFYELIDWKIYPNKGIDLQLDTYKY